ncbi:DUF6609 family protein [Atopococcus tabaci]|uniref:DUF6609 family protein n=1 Tax=Atopococcus tabaci TaxID=269774 RepID=UPI00041870A0|nr:DUF6609 family protein [Atopococcus tabaci]
MEAEKNAVYNNQRMAGVWLIYIGTVILAAAFLGGKLLIQPFVMGIGFCVGYFLIFGLPFVGRKLSYGKDTKFQQRMDNLSVLLSVVLCTIAGIVIGFEDARLVWLLILLFIGLHFFGFYFSQGKLMLLLGILTTLNALAGLWLVHMPFLFFAVMDSVWKIGFGIKFLSMKREDAAA